MGNLQAWGVHLFVSYLLSFHIAHGVLKARILKWFAIPFSRECIRFIHLLWALLSHLSFNSYFASVLFLWLFHISPETCSGIPIRNKYRLEFVSSLSSQSLYSFHYNISKNLTHYLSKSDYVCCAVLSCSVVSEHFLSCLVTLFDPMDYSPSGFSVHGILQAVLQWVVISFSMDLHNPGMESGFPTLQVDTLLSETSNMNAFSYSRLFVTPWPVANQAPLSMGIL